MFPLRDSVPTDATRGGFEYLEFSSYQHGTHEGIDFNCGQGSEGDFGTDLISVAPMRHAWAGETATGFGRHTWFEVTDGPHAGAYCHYAHAESLVHVDPDMLVARGDVIGHCGRSGTVHAHLHFVVTKGRPPTWWWYGGPNLTKDEVEAFTIDPLVFCADYDQWAENGMPAVNAVSQAVEPVPGEDLSPAEQELLATVRELGYPASEAAGLIRQAAGLESDGDSIAGWINEIGALTLRIQQLEADLAEGAPVADAVPSVAVT
ncbi:MAG: M23 family metallopeptidase [Proteobacteria bacterium]|nr:M23 family metallopeptidase [Actinomycetota bacterium]NBY46213.1 M23 family metallopeptidase [Pseudomonadota bacterium]